MKRILLFSLIVLTGCGVTKVAPTSEVRIVERTEWKTDTVFVEIPLIEQVNTTHDTSSHLENGYALSDAVIDKSGKLTHTLSTKPQKRPEIVETPVIYKDSIVTVTQVIEKQVPAELSLSERIKIKAFWVLFVLVVIAYGRFIIRLVK